MWRDRNEAYVRMSHSEAGRVGSYEHPLGDYPIHKREPLPASEKVKKPPIPNWAYEPWLGERTYIFKTTKDIIPEPTGEAPERYGTLAETRGEEE